MKRALISAIAAAPAIAGSRFCQALNITFKIATFFQAVLNNTASRIGKSLFIDCKNNRAGCSTSDNYCSNSAAFSKTSETGISKSAAGNNLLKIEVSPNPSATDFTVTIPNSTNESIEIIVTDMYGKKVYE